MTRKIVSWLSFIAVFLFILQSCRNDDLLSSSEKNTSENALLKKESSASLWKEDETYIRKVRDAYTRYANESYIRNTYGSIFWDYAMTMDTFNESYLIVPVLKDNKVVRTLEVFRIKNKVYFHFSNKDPEANDFFQALIFTGKDNISISSAGKNGPFAKGGSTVVSVCRTITITVGYVEGANGDQYPISSTKTICKFVEVALPVSDCLGDVNPETGECGGGGTGLGYDYPDPPDTPDPCEKLKAQNENSDFKNKIDDLKSKLPLKKETGYVEKINGNFEYKDNASTNTNSNSLSLGDPTSDMKGYLHTHPNNFTYVNEDGYEVERIGFKIFSPADVIYFNQMVALAQQNGLPLENIYAVMISGTGIYQIRFTGNANQIKTVYANSKVQYNEMYINYFLKNKNRSDEMNFLKFIDEQMFVKGISLVKMNNDGTFTTKTLNSDKSGITDSNCPK